MTRKIKIMIVDDEEEIIEKLRFYLKLKGYSVANASNGKDALNKFNDFDADIMITDLKMPEMDGIELIRKCRSKNPELGIIVMTAHGDIDSYIDTQSMGVFEFLNKPFTPEDLDIILNELIQKMNF